MIPTKEEVKKWCAEIEEAIKEKVSMDDPQGVMEKLNKVTELLPLSAQTVALSERHYNEKLGSLILGKEFKGLPATDKKILFASIAADEIHLMTWAEKLNKESHYVIEALRTMLSYLKEQMRNINNGTGA